MSSVGAGGFEFLPFYLYGFRDNSEVPLPDWATYGFGTPAFNEIFKGALQAAQDNGILMDFAVGANQGQGVPSVPETPGLAVHLLAGNASVASGDTFNGPVPPPEPLSPLLLSGLGFIHTLEQFGTPNLTAVIAVEFVSSYITNVSYPFLGDIPTPKVQFNGGSVVDLMDSVNDGSLYWTAPPGNTTWRIFTFWEKYTNQRSVDGGVNATDFIGNGSWTVDHFSRTGGSRTTDFLDQYVLSDADTQSLLRSVGQYAWEDSIEMLATLYWTPGFLQRFEEARGYSLTKYLPLLYIPANSWGPGIPVYPEQYSYGNLTVDESYNIDYRTTLNEGYQEYLKQFSEWSHSRGVGYSSQPAYNLPLQMLSDVPLVDAPEGESLGFQEVLDAYRQFSGPAHLTGRNVISSEVGAVSTPAYSLSIPDLLFRIKRSFAGGFTMMVIHGSPYSGDYAGTTWPGYTTFFYAFTDMWNSIQPAWQHLKDSMDYIGRNQFVLQKGVPRVDLAFYLYAAPWTVTNRYPSTNLQDLGYTYDYLGPDNLQAQEATVDGSNLASDGPAYKALVFASNQTVISANAAESVLRLAGDGLPVFFVGSAPDQILSAASEDQVEVLATIREILSYSNVHRVASLEDLPSALADAGILPRTSLRCSSGPVYTAWRSDLDNGSEYVYIYNDQDVAASCEASFTTQAGAVPYIYDAWTGTRRPALQYGRSSSSITMPLQLQANQTMIVGFESSRKGRSSAPKCAISGFSGNVSSLGYGQGGQIYANLIGPAEITSVSGKRWSFDVSPPSATDLSTWDLSIEDWHAPPDPYEVETAITMHYLRNQTLVPWTSLGPGFDAVSGVGRYNTTFTMPATATGARLGAILSLGPVVHTMRVFINNQQLPPIDPSNPVVDVSSFVRPDSTNSITVEVTTTLFNRIKATANSTMVVGVPAAVAQPGYASSPPQEYGLLGPVSIQWTIQEDLVGDDSC
ncbi:hypothetical protein H2201_001147 [Coniosporium apollinis]|uniref:Secreted protein n=1 Tax=Coniosporium apollinis TaxID=61459 RepID=A0ABQ9P6E1_9PEZI|nr:hypothetical protein H2201_001147 [Coniosporium apollinis]